MAHTILPQTSAAYIGLDDSETRVFCIEEYAVKEYPGKDCDNAYTRVGGCDGWGQMTKETCIQYCKMNITPNPDNCPVPVGGCRYAFWNDDGKWCHLIGNYCEWKDVQGRKTIIDTKSEIQQIDTSGFQVSQSSGVIGGEPSRAIDGNVDGRYHEGSCSQTENQTTSFSWWRLDLDQTRTIHKVVIYIRQDCCSDHINGATVYVIQGSSKIACGEVQYQIDKDVYDIGCRSDGIDADSIVIEKSKSLTLCEVEVYGEEEEEVIGLVSGQKKESKVLGGGVKRGPPGELGERGAIGEKGEIGDVGESGQNDFCLSTDNIANICSAKGDAGIPGSPGGDGSEGEKGERGFAGGEGSNGEKGPRGEKGSPGVPGESHPGEDGIKGINGRNGTKNCGHEQCVLRFGHCYAKSSITLSLQCRNGYAATSIWRNTNFWGLRCCQIIGRYT